jgi:hypothetical protein
LILEESNLLKTVLVKAESVLLERNLKSYNIGRLKHNIQGRDVGVLL